MAALQAELQKKSDSITWLENEVRVARSEVCAADRYVQLMQWGERLQGLGSSGLHVGPRDLR